MVGVQDLARARGIEDLLRSLAPRQPQQPVEVGADHRGLAGRVAHPLEARELPLGLLAHGLGQLGLLDAAAVVVGDRRLVLAELLADRLHLAAQDVLALLLLSAGFDILADPLAHLLLGQALALEPERQLQPLGHVDGLEQLHLLLEGHLGRVGRRVGERARVADRAHEGGDAPVVATQLEDLLDDRTVLALEVAHLDARRLLVGAFLDLDAQAALRIGPGGSGDAAVEALEVHGPGAAREADVLCHGGDRADLGVLAVVARHEQDTLLLADVGTERDVHVGEDDDVVERHEQ
jgi:hypothetical protein